MEKVCSKCKTEYPATLEYFFKHPKCKDGLSSWCKSCRKEAIKQWNNKNRDKKNIHNTKWRMNNPEQAKLSYNKSNNKWYNKQGSGVYGIFSKNICLYIGESITLTRRLGYHKACIKKPSISNQPELYEQIQQYNNIKFRVLETTENHKERESYWINKYQPLYNTKNN